MYIYIHIYRERYVYIYTYMYGKMRGATIIISKYIYIYIYIYKLVKRQKSEGKMIPKLKTNFQNILFHFLLYGTFWVGFN